AADIALLVCGMETRGRTQSHAFVGPAGGGGRVGGDRIVEAVAGRLNDHTMLDAKPFVELEQQFLWRIGRRVAAPFGEGIARARAENMHVSVTSSGWQFQLRLAGCRHPVGRICGCIGAVLHYVSLARVRSKAGSRAENLSSQSTRPG